MSFQPKKILVATDYSANARPAVDAAADLARAYGASLSLVHVIPLSVYVDFAAGVEGSASAALDYQAAVRAAARKSAEAEQARLKAAGVEARVHTLDGPPALQISDLAREGSYDLVVIGTHGRTGLKHVLLGSVAEGVVRHCPVPVLTIRSKL